MKIKLLKPLPGAEVGTIFPNLDKSIQDGYIHVHLPYARIRVDELISSGWAEEIKLEPERWEPKEGDDVCAFDKYGTNLISYSHVESDSDAYRLGKLAEHGLCTRTREELETTLLLLKLRQSNGGWKPKDREVYFAVTVNGNTAIMYYGSYLSERVNDLLTGNCYRTREEAEKYAPEWKKLFSSINNG